MTEKLDFTRQPWILPYRIIEKTLRAKGAVTIRVSSEGEAFDVQVWAKHRGFRVVKMTRYTGGIELDLELAKGEPKAEERRELAEARLRRGTPEVPLSPDIDLASRYLAEPVFKADLILEGKSVSNIRFKPPVTVKEVLEEAAKAAGGECSVITLRGVGEVDNAEIVVCGGEIHAAYAEAGGVQALREGGGRGNWE